MRAAILAMMAIVVSSPALADGLADAPVVFRSGSWSVLRTIDPMTDKASCTGIYKGDASIQLTGKSLYVTVRGGLRGVTLRFGDQPAERMRLASEMEKRIDAIDISGAEFSKLLGSDRLRMQVVTLIRGVTNFDLDLTGIGEAVANIRSGCPGDPVTESTVPAPSLCSDLLLKRMKSNGLTADQIDSICAAP